MASAALNFRSQQWQTIETILSEKENEILGLVEQNDELEKENSELQKALAISGASQEIMNEKKRLADDIKTFSEETRGLRKKVLSEKDFEIVQLYEEIQKLRHKLNNATMDKNMMDVSLLTKTLKERDGEVELLKKKLSEATQEVERTEKLLEDLKLNMSTSISGTTDKKLERIHSLQEQMKEKDKHLAEYERRLKTKGEYGLAEAVSELKAVRAQLDSKERQMDELCQAASRAESARNEISLENEHLRTKLGIALDEPVDLDGYKRIKCEKAEEERAVNEVLQKEIEKLEDERLELKRQLRAAARQLGQKAANENDHVDIALLNIWTDENQQQEIGENLTASAVSANYAAPVRTGTGGMGKGKQEPEIYRSRIEVLNNELGQATETIQMERKLQDEFKVRLSQVTEANVCLEAGLRELQAQLRTGQARLQADDKRDGGNRLPNEAGKPEPVQAIECPSLDKLLAALDAQTLGEDLDTGRFLKSRVDHLEVSKMWNVSVGLFIKSTLSPVFLICFTSAHSVNYASILDRIMPGNISYEQKIWVH
ncbi:unnamed protein product [Echinostoma caproni]|uniref:Uncharacterized protein n=1 Tax=Echinostoma caproni TaxID=27848 RepID=A0A3P8HDA5_9TREM|nr:unnamed protein product [Echinostoma caproni]